MAERQFPPFMQKKSFIRVGEPVIAGYDWTDVVEGVGYSELTMSCMIDSTGKSFILTRNPLRPPTNQFNDATPKVIHISNDGTFTRGGNVTSDVFVKSIDLNFRTGAFNTSRVLNGKMLFNFACAFLTNSTNARWESYISVVAKIIHANATETALFTSSSETKVSLTGNLTRPNYFLWGKDVSNQPIKIGDVLSFQIEVYIRRSAGADSDSVAVMFAYDPLDREIAAIGTTANERLTIPTNETKSTISLPFRIDA